MDVDVSSLAAPPFIMGFAARHPLFALLCGMELRLAAVLFAEFAVAISRPHNFLARDGLF